MMRRFLILFFLFIVLINGYCQTCYYDRFKVIKANSKASNTIQIHDNIDNSSFDFKIKSNGLDLSKFNFKDAEFINNKLYCPVGTKVGNRYRYDLWILTSDTSKRIYLDYRNDAIKISPNGQFMAYYCIADSFINIYDFVQNRLIKRFFVPLNEDALCPYFQKWATDNETFWFFTQGVESTIGNTFAYNLNSGDLKNYDIPDIDMCVDWDINPDRGLCLIDDV